MRNKELNHQKQTLIGSLERWLKKGSGGIDLAEFVEMMSSNFEVTETELLEAFHTFDTDGNVVLCEDEILTVMRALGMWLNKEQVKKMMIDADKDNSGDISYEELVQYMRD